MQTASWFGLCIYVYMWFGRFSIDVQPIGREVILNLGSNDRPMKVLKQGLQEGSVFSIWFKRKSKGSPIPKEIDDYENLFSLKSAKNYYRLSLLTSNHFIKKKKEKKKESNFGIKWPSKGWYTVKPTNHSIKQLFHLIISLSLSKYACVLVGDVNRLDIS